MSQISGTQTPRQLADSFVHSLADLDPQVASGLGLRTHDDRVPDLSPQGHAHRVELVRATLAHLDQLEADSDAASWDELERRCATLLRDRLGVEIEAYETGEHLRAIRNIFGPPQAVRQMFAMMPTSSHEDWACIARRMAKIPAAYASYRECLDEGQRQGLYAAPRQAETLAGLLDDWVSDQWFHKFVADGPSDLTQDLTSAADAATQATAELRDYLRRDYAPAAVGTPDAVGEQRYRANARRWIGADIDPHEVYAWGWQEFLRLNEEMKQLAEVIKPGATPVEAMRHLDDHGRQVEGVEEVQQWLQRMMDQAIEDLNGTHFDIAEPLQTVEAMIAPSGSAAAPYYSRPSVDFSRPGRTWLPTLGRDRFPVYDLVSTWYHEGVPGHHLQLAQWVYVAPQLSIFQATIGSSSGNTEGWALYAERLMDELGYLDDEERMGYLDCQMMRAIRVVIDIGMHLGLTIPSDSPIAPGEVWSPELAEEFFLAHSGHHSDFIASEIVRYLGWPAQAISYKVGERVWLEGRQAAQVAHDARGEPFDLKSWHMAALSLGALGLDDLKVELARL